MLAILVVAAPIPFGSARGLAVSTIECTIFATLALSLAAGALDRGLPRLRPLAWPAVLFAVFVLLQSVPLPLSIVGVASPAAESLTRRMVEAPEARWWAVSLDPHATRLFLLRFAAYAGAFAIVACVELPGRKTHFVWAILVSGGTAAAIAWAHSLSGWESSLFGRFAPAIPIEHERRFHWPLVNPNHFAALMNLGWPVALGALIWPPLLGANVAERGSLPHRGFAAVVLLATFGALAATRSRGGLASAMVALVAMMAAWPAEEGKERVLVIAARIVAILAIAAGGSWILQELASPMSVEGNLVASGHQDASFRLRVEIARQTWPIIRDYWGLGTGAGTWETAFPRYEAYPLFFASFAHVHDDYVESLSDLGVAGTLLLGALAVALATNVLRRDLAVDARRARAILIAPLAATAVHALGDFALRIPANALSAAVLLGLLWKICTPEKELAHTALARSRGLVLATIGALALVVPATHEGADAWMQRADAEAPTSPDRIADWRILDRAAWSVTAGGPPDRRLALLAVDRCPAAGEAHRTLAFAYRSIAMRERELGRAVEASPGEAAWRLDLARLLVATGRTDEAKPLVERAVYDAPAEIPRDLVSFRDPRTGRDELLPSVLAGLERRAAESPETIASYERERRRLLDEAHAREEKRP